MASVEWERSGDSPRPTSVDGMATEEPQRSLTVLPAEPSAALSPIAATPGQKDVAKPNEGADPYEAAVERLFVLLEENQVAIATLAQAWRHKSRALELAQDELARTQEALAAERQIRRETTG